MILSPSNRILSFNGKILDWFAMANDLLSPLVSNETAITGATTLDNTAFGKMFVCSGTSASYAVGLPDVSGNTGKFIGFRMAPTLTKIVSITANASETIDGENVRPMWANEVAILFCNGTTWTKIAGKSIGFYAKMYVGTNGQSFTSNSLTKINLDTTSFDNSGMMANTSQKRINIIRKGLYRMNGATIYTALTTNNCQAKIYLNGSEIASDSRESTGGYPTPQCNTLQSANLNDYLELYTYMASAGSLYVIDPGLNYLLVQEVTSW